MTTQQGITVIPLSDDDSDYDSVSAPVKSVKQAHSAGQGESLSRSVHAMANTAATDPAPALVSAQDAGRHGSGTEAAAPSAAQDTPEAARGGIEAARGAALARVSTDEEVLTITEAGTGKEYKVQKVRGFLEVSPTSLSRPVAQVFQLGSCCSWNACEAALDALESRSRVSCYQDTLSISPLKALTCVPAPWRAQKYTIRDLTTGKLFVLDSSAPDPGSPAANSAAAAADAGPSSEAHAAPGLARQVTDVQSGRGMTLEEFDQALGLHSALRVRKPLRDAGRGSDCGSKAYAALTVQPTKRVLKTSTGRWAQHGYVLALRQIWFLLRLDGRKLGPGCLPQMCVGKALCSYAAWREQGSPLLSSCATSVSIRLVIGQQEGLCEPQASLC